MKGWMKGGGEANTRALRLHRSSLLATSSFLRGIHPFLPFFLPEQGFVFLELMYRIPKLWFVTLTYSSEDRIRELALDSRKSRNLN